MQAIQVDPRFMEVFKEMTGIDLQQMGEERAKKQEEDEEARKKREAEEKVRAEQEEAARKAAAEAALPDEERQVLERERAAEAKKLEGNNFYKAKDFPNAIAKYNEAIELNPREMTFYTNLAAVHFEMAEYERVLELCE